VRTERSRIATAVALATVLLVVMLGLRLASVQQTLSVYVLVLRRSRSRRSPASRAPRPPSPPPSAFDAALRIRPVDPMRPSELVRTERDITLGLSNAGLLDQRLLPMLREAAAARLSANHNVELERRPDAARALLGDDAWELVRPDRPQPADRNAPGIPPSQLRDLIATLERL